MTKMDHHREADLTLILERLGARHVEAPQNQVSVAAPSVPRPSLAPDISARVTAAEFTNRQGVVALTPTIIAETGVALLANQVS